MRRQDISIEREVLHVFAALDRGGAEIRTLEMMQHLSSVGHQHIVTLSGRAGELGRDFEAAGASVSPLDVRSILFPLRLGRLLRRKRISVVHAHVSLYSGYVLYLAKLFGVSGRVAHFRSDATGLGSGFMSMCQSRVLHALVDHAATSIVGVSPSSLVGAWTPDWQFDSRCRVLLSGVDLDAIGRGVELAEALRADLGLNAGRKVVLHVGRDIPTKNRARAIDIVASIRRSPPPVLIFVGRDDPTNRRRLQAHASQLGILQDVHFLGDRQDVPALMAAADLLLVTSTLEGMPGVVVEASAAGTPVLASDLEGTIYLADRLAGITILRQECPNVSWASQADTLLAEGVEIGVRRARIESLRGTEFDVMTAIQGYLDIWDAAIGEGKSASSAPFVLP